jgi:hypothetical protein
LIVARHALTYARRYALFTLVGIAGEDDLDAPDLGAGPAGAAEPPGPPDDRKQANGQAAAARPRAPLPNSARTVLGVQLSASLRESLIEQLAVINSADEAAAWAHRNLPAKNKLMAADAKMVEERFQARLLQMDQQVSAKETSAAPPAPAWIPDGSTPAGLPHDVPTQSRASASVAVTSSVQALGKPVRLRDKDHRRYVQRQACLVCGRVPSDPHHLTFTQPRALGRRVSDEFIVPVCRIHHRALHRSGNEVAWWQKFNIDPIPVALRLWQHTRSDDRTSPDARTELKASTQGEATDGVPKAPA